MDSKIPENHELVFAIMKAEGVSPKAKVKYLDYLYNMYSLYNVSNSLYPVALMEFYEDVLSYDSRRRKKHSTKITKV